MSKEKIKELEEEIEKLKEQSENFVFETIEKIEGDEELPDRLREDKEFVLKALKHTSDTGGILRELSEKLKDDKDFVIEAIVQFLEALEKYDFDLEYTSRNILHYNEFLLKALRKIKTIKKG